MHTCTCAIFISTHCVHYLIHTSIWNVSVGLQVIPPNIGTPIMSITNFIPINTPPPKIPPPKKNNKQTKPKHIYPFCTVMCVFVQNNVTRACIYSYKCNLTKSMIFGNTMWKYHCGIPIWLYRDTNLQHYHHHFILVLYMPLEDAYYPTGKW